MDADGIDEALTHSLRNALMVSSQIGEQLARMNESRQRHAEAAAAQDSRELQSRLDTERLAARAQLATIDKPGWWDTAKPEEIGEVWQTANAWRTIDPEIDRAADRIETEVRDRWGVDVNNPGANPDEVAATLRKILEANEAADNERAQAKKDEAEAIKILLEADRMASDREAGLVDDVPREEELERELRGTARDLKSSAAAHEQSAAKYEEYAETEAGAAKMVADTGQAAPAHMATSAAAKSSKKLRRGSGDQAQERSVSR